jgi:hypothetical protein
MNENALRPIGLLVWLFVLAGCGSSGTTKNAHNAGDAGASPTTVDGNTGEAGASPSTADGGASAFVPGPPITGLMEKTWIWVDVPEAHCRDGSTTGFGVSANSASDKLMIFLEGGSACFDSLTCSVNASSASGSGFTGPASGNNGVLNRDDAANPVRDWNFVDIPYCTGDVHAGNNPNGMVAGVAGTQQFVGYPNMHEFLKQIVPTFPNVKQVLLTGTGAGGFGASANSIQVGQAFPASVQMYVLDDSGPPMDDPYAANCLQQQWVTLWGFDKTIVADCGSDCADMTNYPIKATAHGLKTHPTTPVGIIESTDDNTITLFYGFGQNNCTGSISTPLSATQFKAGLDDMRTQLMAYPNFGAYVFSGTQNGIIADPATFDSQTAGGVKLTDWIAQLVDSGKVTNVGP